MDFPNRWSGRGVYMMRLCSLLYGFSLVASNGIVTETAKGAPPTVPDGVKTKYIIQEGTKNWKLTCAAEGDRPLLITWAKDGESITSAWPRYKQLNEARSLQIKNVALEDAGTYKCRAANGFGSVDVEYTVVVVDKGGLLTSTVDEYADDDFVPPDISHLPSVKGAGRAPFWVGGDPTAAAPSSGLVRAIGGSVKLRCHATGLPKPDIIWLKDGRELDDAAIGWSRGKWALHLKDLRPEDTGNYTCRIYNIFGSLNASFLVRIQSNDFSLPRYEQLYPLNTTVLEGQPATLHCRVRSQDKPVLQWIKVIEDPSHLEFNQSVEVQGLHIAVLDKKYSSDMVDFRNSTYSKSLRIPATAASDAGWYVCVVTSQKGHLSHRLAFLNVITDIGQPLSPRDHSLPLHIVVGIPVAFVLLLLVGYAVYFLQKHQHKPSRLPPTAQPSSSSSATSSHGQRPPPPAHPPPSLPPSSSQKTTTGQNNAKPISQNCVNSSSGESNSSQSNQRQQQQPLLWSKENGFAPGSVPAASMCKAVYKTYHCLDPQLTAPLTSPNAVASESPNHLSNVDSAYDPTVAAGTPQPYELRYDESDLSDICGDTGGAIRMQHYPTMYSCR